MNIKLEIYEKLQKQIHAQMATITAANPKGNSVKNSKNPKEHFINSYKKCEVNIENLKTYKNKYYCMKRKQNPEKMSHLYKINRENYHKRKNKRLENLKGIQNKDRENLTNCSIIANSVISDDDSCQFHGHTFLAADLTLNRCGIFRWDKKDLLQEESFEPVVGKKLKLENRQMDIKNCIEPQSDEIIHAINERLIAFKKENPVADLSVNPFLFPSEAIDQQGKILESSLEIKMEVELPQINIETDNPSISYFEEIEDILADCMQKKKNKQSKAPFAGVIHCTNYSKFLELVPSPHLATLGLSGRGLIAKEKIGKNIIIGPYLGVKFSEEKLKAIYLGRKAVESSNPPPFDPFEVGYPMVSPDGDDDIFLALGEHLFAAEEGQNCPAYFANHISVVLLMLSEDPLNWDKEKLEKSLGGGDGGYILVNKTMVYTCVNGTLYKLINKATRSIQQLFIDVCKEENTPKCAYACELNKLRRIKVDKSLPTPQYPREHNVEIHIQKGKSGKNHVIFLTSNPVEAGKELLACYGDDFLELIAKGLIAKNIRSPIYTVETYQKIRWGTTQEKPIIVKSEELAISSETEPTRSLTDAKHSTLFKQHPDTLKTQNNCNNSAPLSLTKETGLLLQEPGFH